MGIRRRLWFCCDERVGDFAQGDDGRESASPAADCASFFHFTSVFQKLQQSFMYFKLCASLGSSARTQRGGWGAAGDSFWQMYGKHPCRGRRPDAPAAAPHFSPDVRRIRSRHCREGACPFRQQTPRHAPPSGESANVLRIRRRAFYVVIGAARKGQALSLQGSVCEFAIGGGIGKVLLRGVPGRHALQLSGCEFA